MEDKLNIAYKALSEKYNVGSVEDFRAAMQDDNKAKKAYDALSESYNVGDYDTFVSSLRPKDSYIKDLGERALSGLAGVPASSLNLLGKISKGVEDVKDKVSGGISDITGWDKDKVSGGIDAVTGMFKNPAARLSDTAIDILGEKPAGIVDKSAQYFKGVQQKYADKSDRYRGKDFWQLGKEGRYGDALGEIFLSATQSLPQSLIIAGTGGAGLIGTGLTTASDKWDQLSEQKPEMNQYAKLGNAIVTGASEALTEVFGAGTLGRVVKNALETGGKKAAAKAIERGFLDKLADISTKHYVLAPVIEEGLEETTNAFVEYAMDKLTGVEREDSLGEAMFKSAVYGAAGGMQYTPVTAGAHYYTDKSKKRITNTYNETKPVAESILGDKIGDFDAAMDRLDEKGKGALIDNVAIANGLNKEQKESLLNYSGARISYNNYVENVEKEISEEQTKAAEEIKSNSNKDMGSSVILKSGEEDVNVVGGVVRINEDGKIDTDLSDETVYVKGKDGKITPRLITEFSGVSSITPLDKLYAERLAGIRESILAQEEEDVLNIPNIQPLQTIPSVQDVVVTPDGKQGVVSQIDNDETVVVVYPDGTSSAFRPEELLTPTEEVTNTVQQPQTEQEIAQPAISQEALQTQSIEAPAQGTQSVPQTPLDKDGNVDYSAIQDPNMFATALQGEFGEDASSVIEDLLSEQDVLLKKAEKSNNAIQRRRAIAKVKAEIDRLNSVKEIILPTQPVNQNESNNDVLSDNMVENTQQNEVLPSDEQSNVSETPQTHEEHIQSLIDNGTDPKEIAEAYASEMENAGYEALLPWQQALIGRRINKASIERFGDKNKISGSIAKSWINKKDEETSNGTIDAIAQELSEYGVEVTPEDIIQFIYDHPSNRIKKGNEVTKGLNESFKRAVKELTGQNVGGIESNSAKLILAGMEAGKRSAEEQAQLPFQGATIPDAMINFFEATEKLPEEFGSFEDFNNFVEQELQNGTFDFPLSEKDYAQIKTLINHGIEQSRDWEDYARRIEKARNGRATQPAIFEELGKEETGNELRGLFGEQRDTERSGDVDAEPQPIGVGPFGKIYDQFKGKAKEAIAFLIGKKDGEAIGALHHKDVGDIDLVWGKEGNGKSNGFGLSKLVKFHPEVIPNLQEILDDMSVSSKTENRVNLESATHKAAIRLEWDGDRKNWLLTAFEKETPTPIDRTTDIDDNLNDKQNDTAPLLNVDVSNNKATSQNDNVQTNSVKNESPIDIINRIAKEETAKQSIKSAEQEVDVNPTDAQKEAGNYKKGHLSLNGFDITIEQPKGSTRSGIDQDGKEWSIEMQNTYGYFKGTKAVDGDHIDVFIGDNPTSKKVFVIDQVNKDGSFDEHKVLFGFDTLEDAKSGYLSNYEGGWQGLGSVTEVSMADFKKWIDSSTRKTKPFAEYKSIQNPQHDILFRDGEGSSIDSYINDNNLGAIIDYAKQDVDKYKDYARAKGRLDVILKHYEAYLRTGLVERRKKVAEAKEYLYGQFPDIEKHIEEQKERKRIAVGQMEAARKAEQEKQASIEKARIEEEKRQEPYTRMSNKELDKAYMEAVESNDEEVMRRCINESASRNGYEDNASYQGEGTWRAPSKSYDTMQERKDALANESIDVNIEDIANGVSVQPDDIFTNHRAYGHHGVSAKSANIIADAISSIKDGKKPTIKVYRAVPKDVKESANRSGDWVTPSKEYAKMHGDNRLKGEYRIIEQDVLASDLWWDGNDVNEWGYDDGGDYRYKNTKNNRKLNDLITYDDKGNIIPPSKRFNQRKEDVRFKGEEINNRFNDELQQQIDGTLPKGHIYQLGNPSNILQSAGVPNFPIELSASQLEYKATSGKHDYDLNKVMDLPNAISNPIATFKYGDKNKSQNILTVLDHNGENFLVGLFIKPTAKGKVLEINSIRNVFPKNSDGIVNWINDDKLTFANKEKLLEFLDQQRTNHADVAFVLPDEQVKQENQEAVSSATNIVNDFVNPTLNDGKMMSEAEDLTNALGGGVRIVRDVNEITDDDKSKEKRKRASKGWFDPKTGEVVIVLPNNTSIADVQATVLHEMVAHKGLRGLLGDKFDEMMDSIYKNLPDSAKETVTRAAVTKYNLDTRVATEEYLASIAEKGVDRPETWNRIKSAIKEFFRSMGINLQITDEDIAYLLWKSKNKLEKGESPMTMIEKASKDVDMRELLYRDSDKDGYMDLDAEKRRGVYDAIDSIKRSFGEKTLLAKKTMEKFKEAYADSMLTLQKFQDMTTGKTGELIKDFENAYIDQNSSLSRSTNEIEEYKDRTFKPLIEEIYKLMGVKEPSIWDSIFSRKKIKEDVLKKKEEVTNYMMAKHGLERNAKMRDNAVRELENKLNEKFSSYEDSLLEELEKKKASNKYSEKEIAKEEKRIEKLLDNRRLENKEKIAKKQAKQEVVDYSGLTALSKELFDSDFMMEKKIREHVTEYEKDNDTSKLWEAAKNATQASIKKMYESGCMTKEQYNNTLEMYQNYVPLREWAEPTAGDLFDYYFKEEKDTLNGPLKTAKGRESKAGDILANIYSMYETSVFVGNKNRTKLKLLNMVRNHIVKNGLNDATVSKQWFINRGNEDNPNWEAALPELTDDPVKNVEIINDFEKEMKDLQEQGLAKITKDFLNLKVPVKSWQAEQHAIQVKENGEDIVIYINGDPSIAQAVNGLNKKRLDGKVMRIVGSIGRFMKNNFTSRNIEFIFKNLFRDSWFVNNMNIVEKGWKYEFRYIKNYRKASGAIMRSITGKEGSTEEKRYYDRMFSEFKKNGGRTGFVALNGYNRLKNSLEKEFSKLSGKRLSPMQIIGLLGGYIETMNSYAEDLNRFNVYLTSREDGQSITQSIKDAKDSSVNFDRKGSGAYGAAVLNANYFFFNAGVQAQNRYWGLFKKAPVQMALYSMLPFFMQGFIVSALMNALKGDEDDDWYNNLPEYIRQNNICLKVPGIDHILIIPIDIQQRIFLGLGDMFAQYVRGEYNGRNFPADVVGKMMDFLPMNFLGSKTQDSDYFTVGNIARQFIPDYISPVTDALIYNDGFYGQRISARNQYNEDKPEYRKATKGTSGMAVGMSKMLNSLTGGDYATKGWADSELLNPSAVEYMMEQYLGGVGKVAAKTYKSMESVLNGEMPAIRNIPVVGQFVYDPASSMPNNVVNERYKGYVELSNTINYRDNMYIDGLEKGEPVSDNYRDLRESKDYRIAQIANSFKPNIDNLMTQLWTMEESLQFMDKDAKTQYEKMRKDIFSNIHKMKKEMLNEIDKLK